MKKLSVALMAGIILFASACENNGSSTTGTYEKEEVSHTEGKSEEHGKEEHDEHETRKDGTNHTSGEANEEGVKLETPKVSVGVDDNGVDVQTKSFKKDSTKH
jgi:hypothetical protein